MENHGKIIDFVTYCSLKAAIPSNWKREMKDIATQEDLLDVKTNAELAESIFIEVCLLGNDTKNKKWDFRF